MTEKPDSLRHESMRLRRLCSRILALEPHAERLVKDVEALQKTARGILDDIEAVVMRRDSMARAQDRSAEVRKEAYWDRVRVIQPVIQELRRSGRSSYQQIADGLLARGHKPPKGNRWSYTTIRSYENAVLPEKPQK